MKRDFLHHKLTKGGHQQQVKLLKLSVFSVERIQTEDQNKSIHLTLTKMKKKIITVAAVISFLILATSYSLFSTENKPASSVTQQNIEALTRTINPDCPNGCVEGKDGCWCYKRYKEYSEHDWND